VGFFRPTFEEPTHKGNNAQEEERTPAGATEIMDYSFAENVLSPLPGLA
jgi:hypothetical protein